MCLIKITTRKPAKRGYGLKKLYGPHVRVDGTDCYESLIYFGSFFEMGKWSESPATCWQITPPEYDPDGKSYRYRPYYHLWLERREPPDVEVKTTPRTTYAVFEYDGATVEGVEPGVIPAVVAKRVKLLAVGSHDAMVGKMRELRAKKRRTRHGADHRETKGKAARKR